MIIFTMRPKLWQILSPFFLCVGLFITELVYSTSTSITGPGTLPWFTGPLLTPSAFVLKPGSANMEPYVFYGPVYGSFDDDWVPRTESKMYVGNVQFTYKIGLTEYMDLSGTFQSFWREKEGCMGGSFGDLPIGLDFQLFISNSGPDVALGKLYIGEIFPTGRYQHLNPHKLGTDKGGNGSYVTVIGLTFSKQQKFSEEHYVRGRWNISFAYPSPVHVEGLNSFGGDVCTNGTVYPGVVCTFLTSGEYTITNNWVLACDFQASYSSKTRFSGRTTLGMTSPFSVQFSLAPAIEYNWDETVGVIVGGWFTVAGKNCRRFVTGVAGLNYNF